MTWADPQSTHNPAAGLVIPSAWGDSVRNAIVATHGAPRVRVYKGATQSIGGGTTEITFEFEQFDTHGMHDNFVNSPRLTVPSGWSGHWCIGGSVLWEQSATGTYRNLELHHSSAGVLAQSIVGITASGYAAQSVQTIFEGVPGEYYVLKGSHDAGAGLGADPTPYAGCNFYAFFVGYGVG